MSGPDLVRTGLGSIWTGLGWSGPGPDTIWTGFGPDLSGPDLVRTRIMTDLDRIWLDLDRFGPIWTDLDRIWTDLDRFGPDLTLLEPKIQIHAPHLQIIKSGWKVPYFIELH